jgi:anaerobic carbon-monoxide dehydrogenase iron sulfur subunit
MKVVYVDLFRCLGCFSCQQICAFRQNEYHHCCEPNIRVRVDMDRRLIFTSTCRQCETPACRDVCPVQALHRDPETMAVVVDRQVCLGCGLCVTACPNGHIHLEGSPRTATKCDLCHGDPQCVQVCMAHALYFGDVSEMVEKQYKQKKGDFMVQAVDAGEL